MERKVKSVRPVAAPATVVIPWWNRPITWAIAVIVLLLALVGFLAPDRTPASSSPMTVERPVLSLSEGTPAATVDTNHGHVNVTKGQAVVDTNYGTVNIGSINIGTEQPVAVAPERVIERVVVEKPVERRVYIERKVPVIVDHYPIYVQRDTDKQCEESAAECEKMVAKWRANPFDGYEPK